MITQESCIRYCSVHAVLHNEDLYLCHLLLGPRPCTLIISSTTSVFYRNKYVTQAIWCTSCGRTNQHSHIEAY